MPQSILFNDLPPETISQITSVLPNEDFINLRNTGNTAICNATYY
ncbi:MAG: hypothetical protein ACI9CD_000508 [Candidatus Deianiraeaceae bacterium]|jgi:hypothetical protein